MIYGTFLQSPYFWYLISGRQIPLIFLFLLFQEFREPNEQKERNLGDFSSEGITSKEDQREESHGAQVGWAHAARYRGRMGPTNRSLGHLHGWGFLRRSSSSPKSHAVFFPELSEAVTAAKLLDPFEGVRSCYSGAPGEGEIIAIVITSPPWRGRRPLHHHHHQDQHHLHHHPCDPSRSPHSLRAAIP